ncbi:MAG: ATP-binding cassette domain-containing protein [Promethearchaeota archaeon]|nr:MAG: ATP-binding cassette domain-containing protein [Candidatus Lokiarchaeota archaeon]
MALIKFENFYYRYKGNEEYALNNINLKIDDDNNSLILLCGETGSGKTSLIRCMNGLIPQFYAGFYKGKVIVNGKDTINTPIADLSTEVGIVFQNPENQLITMNVEHEIAFGLENLGVPPKIISSRLKESVSITEIEHILDKAPFELSGGEQQRVAIASILVLEPKILILDEPTALLDPYMARKIINLLQEIKGEKNITILISEHRLDLILPFTDQLILMKSGEVIEHGSCEKVINGKNFQSLRLNKPVIYSIFNKLKKEKLYNKKIPTSIPEAVKSLKMLLSNR